VVVVVAAVAVEVADSSLQSSVSCCHCSSSHHYGRNHHSGGLCGDCTLSIMTVVICHDGSHCHGHYQDPDFDDLKISEK
jgi:hypothetical protein